jgi:ferritin-like metal-binding protein YciE
MANLKDLFLDEVADMYDAETRISKALPKLAKAATSSELKDALLKHQKETLGHIENLKRVFEAFDEKAKGKECKATVGLLKEGDEIAEENEGEPTIDAGVISACQKVEHYEIASYESLIEWAKLLENDDAVSALEQNLEEEKNASETLKELAVEANAEANEEDSEEETSEESEQEGETQSAAKKTPQRQSK